MVLLPKISASRQLYEEVYETWIEKWPLHERCPDCLLSSVDKFIDALLTEDPRRTAAILPRMVIGGNSVCGGGSDGSPWLESHKAEYGQIVWELLRRSGQMKDVHEILRGHLDGTAPEGPPDLCLVVSQDYGRMLLEMFLTCRPDPAWVKPRRLT